MKWKNLVGLDETSIPNEVLAFRKKLLIEISE